MKTLKINQTVNVTRMSFGRDMRAYPKAIEHDGRTYEFVDRGLSCSVQRGAHKARIFTLSDGAQQFWLRDGGHGIWTLLGMSS